MKTFICQSCKRIQYSASETDRPCEFCGGNVKKKGVCETAMPTKTKSALRDGHPNRAQSKYLRTYCSTAFRKTQARKLARQEMLRDIVGGLLVSLLGVLVVLAALIFL